MSKKKKGKKHQGYLPIQNMLNSEVALTQAAFALDGAFFAAQQAGDAEQMATVGALWLEMSNRLGPLKSQQQQEPQVQGLASRPFKTGFSGPEDEYDEYEEEEYDGIDE